MRRDKRITIADMAYCPTCTQLCWKWELDPAHPWQPKHVHNEPQLEVFADAVLQRG